MIASPDECRVCGAEIVSGLGRCAPCVSEDDGMMTTQEVANVLNVSRPFVVKLCEQGEIPAVRVGNRWRIEGRHLDLYNAVQNARKALAVLHLTEEAQRLGIAY